MDPKKYGILALLHSHIVSEITFKKGHSLRFKYLTVLSFAISYSASLLPRTVLDYYRRNVSLIKYSVKIPKNLLNECIDYTFYQHLFPVPEEFENYLGYRYGDWKTQVRDYNFLTDDNATLK